MPNMDSNTKKNKSTELDASQANFVWSFFPESDSSNEKKFSFQHAPAQVNFSNLKHALQIYESIPEDTNIVKIELNALIALAVNDFASSAASNSGRMRHCWGHDDAYEDKTGAYFALRAWDEVESSEWKTLYTPKYRLWLSAHWQGWHWKSASTRVVPVRVLQFSVPPGSRDEASLSLYVPGRDLESARRCAKGAVLLCAGDRLWFSAMKDFLVSDVDSGVQLSLCDEGNGSEKADSLLRVRWSSLRTDKDGGDWLRDHELVSHKLELALCEKLQEVILSEDDSCSTLWFHIRVELFGQGSLLFSD